nr:uncharacterized protein LOC104847212 [Loxodonta africana]
MRVQLNATFQAATEKAAAPQIPTPHACPFPPLNQLLHPPKARRRIYTLRPTAGGGGNAAEWSLDAADAAGWSGAAAGADGVFREGGVRGGGGGRRCGGRSGSLWRQPRKRERKEGRERGVLRRRRRDRPGSSPLCGGGRPGRRFPPCPRAPQFSRPPTRGPGQLLRPPGWQRRAGASAEAGVGAAATAMAFLKLRDQDLWN